MILFDVNVLVNAHVTGQTHRAVAAELLERTLAGPAPFALSELVLSAFVRITTHPRALVSPTRLPDALAFCRALREHPGAHLVAPGARHWSIFERLCMAVEAKGSLIPDAYLAALAIEHGCEWISFDRDFARFPGLRWRSPLG